MRHPKLTLVTFRDEGNVCSLVCGDCFTQVTKLNCECCTRAVYCIPIIFNKVVNKNLLKKTAVSLCPEALFLPGAFGEVQHSVTRGPARV